MARRAATNEKQAAGWELKEKIGADKVRDGEITLVRWTDAYSEIVRYGGIPDDWLQPNIIASAWASCPVKDD